VKARASKFVALLILLTSVSLLLTSCWSAREIDQLAFVAAMGIDREDDTIKLTVQIIVGGGGGGGGESDGAQAPVWITSSTGNSLSEAVFNLNLVVSKTPFWSHSYVMIIGEDLAREGIAEVLEWMGRDRQARDTLLVAVTLGKAEDILKVEPKMTQLPAEYIETLLRLGAKTGYIPNGHLFRIRLAYANQPGMQAMMPLIQPQPQEDTGGSSGVENPAAGIGESDEGEEQKAESIELKGTAVFRDDRMVGTLDLRESRGVAWLTGQISDSLVTINRTEGQITQRADFTQVKYRLRKIDGNVKLEARVTQDGVLQSWPLRGVQSITPTILAQLEEDLAREIEGEVRAALAKLQGEFNADIAGLGERLRRLDSSLYRSLDWDKAFPTLQLATEIEASFRRIGLTKE